MAEYQEVMKQKKRIHKYYISNFCNGCPIGNESNEHNLSCSDFIYKYPQEAEELIMKWADANPIMTNADVFEKVFGLQIGDNCELFNCNPEGCEHCKWKGYWDREYKEPKEV